MSLHPIHAAVRLPGRTFAIALGLALAACGGGVEDRAETPSVASVNAAHRATEPLAATVTVAGCVLDRHYIPTIGTPVRALAADGRLLGNALSDAQGRFTLRPPAPIGGSEVMLQIDRPQGKSLPLRMGALLM